MSSPLPFLQDRDGAAGGVIGEVQMVDPGIYSAAFELIKALESKDPQAVASALKNAFELLDSQPHEEGPHLGIDPNRA